MSIAPYYRYLLLERGSGFHFSGEPPSGLLSSRSLESSDPTIVISAVLAHAKEGRFDVFGSLLRVMREDGSADVWNACTNLLAYAAPYSVLREVLHLFHAEIYERRDGPRQEYAGRIVGGGKGLWAVPVLLDLFFRVRDRHRHGSMPVYLSYLLEPERGEIAAGPSALERSVSPAGTYDDLFDAEAPEPDDASYRRIVVDAYARVAARINERDHERVAIFGGIPLSVEQVAKDLLVRLFRNEDSEEVEIGRMILEAFTGADCTVFYRPGGRLRPLAAAAVVERFLESGEAEQFGVGARYFFRHRIPD